MVIKQTRAASPLPTDRRSGQERRKVDKAPPGGRDRRVSVEPRKPEVQELEITPSAWADLTSRPEGLPSAAPAAKKAAAKD
jgi:hypothetical protein